MKNKKNLLAVFFVLFVMIAGFVISHYFIPNKASNLSNLDTFQEAAIIGGTQPMSAFIVDVYTKHFDSTSMSCKNTTICSSYSTDSSNDASRTYTISSPYTEDKQPVMEATANARFTAAFADRYGITGNADSGRLDLKIPYSGTETLTQTGPNGKSITLTIPPKTWIAIGGPQEPTNNVKGSDSSANWSKGENGQSIDGVWTSYSYSGDSRKSLIIKGDSTRRYNVVLSGFAKNWHLNKASDSGPNFNPTYFINGSEIFCPKIRIMGTRLNYDCKRSFTLGPGTYDVTPSVDVSRYFYSVFVISISDAGPASSPTPPTTSS